MNSQIPSGWYPDPSGLSCERFWDGSDWTEKTRPISTFEHMPPPQLNTKTSGLDSSEKVILAIILVSFVLIALISSGY